MKRLVTEYQTIANNANSLKVVLRSTEEKKKTLTRVYCAFHHLDIELQVFLGTEQRCSLSTLTIQASRNYIDLNVDVPINEELSIGILNESGVSESSYLGWEYLEQPQTPS